jgi:PAS domain S-box-containing protein
MIKKTQNLDMDQRFLGHIKYLYMSWDEEGEILEASDDFINIFYVSKNNFFDTYKKVDDLLFYPEREWLEKVSRDISCNNLYLYVKLDRKNPTSFYVMDIFFEESNRSYNILFRNQSTSLHQVMVENSTTGMFVSTVDGKFLEINEKLAMVYGYSKAKNELLSLDITSEIYVNREDRNLLIQKLSSSSVVKDFRFIARHKSGNLLIISKDVYPDFWCNDIKFFYGYVRDITKEIGEENSPIPTCIFSADGKIIYANKAMATTLGYTREELLEKTDIDLYSNIKDRKNLFYQLRIGGEKNEYLSYVSLKKKNGDSIEIHINSSAVYDNDRLLYIKSAASGKQPEISDKILLNQNIEKLCEEISKVIQFAIKKYSLNIDIDNLLNSTRNFSNQISLRSLDEKEVSEIASEIKFTIQEYAESFIRSKDSNDITDEIDLYLSSFSLESSIQLKIEAQFNHFLREQNLLKDSLTSSQLASLLQVSEDQVKSDAFEKFIYFLYRGDFMFPAWQFYRNSRGEEILSRLLQVANKINKVSELSKIYWIITKNHALNNLSPLEIIREGDKACMQRLLEEAYSIGRF